MDRHETEKLLRQFGIRPTHSLGQNFLVDERVGQHILQMAGPERDDQVIEIGPGLGALTRELAAAAGRIVAVEIDRHLIPVLEHVLMISDNCQILNQDALNTDLAALAAEWPGPTLVTANLPYYITTPIIEKILCELPECRRLVFTVQKEAADRLLAGPGSKAYGPAAILLALHGTAKCSLIIPPAAFWPRPHIESTVLVIARETTTPGAGQLPSAPHDRRQFLRFLNQCFRQRRKKLANNLPALPDRPIRAILEQGGLSPDIRAEQMAPDQFLVLWHLLV
jgi:16S rRNA (adenine1518-N6/adenine1519-N6)-dimethyltransferase